MVITTEIEKKKEKWKINHIKFTLRYRLERRMTQRKFVFMKFEDSLFLHFSEFCGEGAPVEVQVVGEALAVPSPPHSSIWNPRPGLRSEAVVVS